MGITNCFVSQVANFLIHLVRDKNLKPSTISGYRTSIADGLGASGDSISNSREINRLLSSFHRDKPRMDRGIPAWDISVVLLALTKEPLSKATLKHLAYKTVFLLSLASGKHRSEPHA